MNNCTFDTNEITAFNKGDETVFRKIYYCYNKHIFTFAERVLGNHDDAKDIVNETFAKLWIKRAQFSDLSNINSFLFTVTRNACLDFFRKVKSRNAKHLRYSYLTDAEDYQPDPENEMIRAATLKKILDIIEDLPAECQDIFKLLFFKEMKPDEVASHKNISVNTVRSQKKKALDLIKMTILNGKIPFIILVILLFWLFIILKRTYLPFKRTGKSNIDIYQV